MKKKRIFKTVYKFYVLVLFLIMIFCIGSVYKILIDFEKNQPDAYVRDVLSSMKNKQIESLFTRNEDYETSKEFTSNVKKFFKSKDCEIRKEDTLIYGVYLGKKQLLKVSLESIKHVNKIGIISYDVLKTKSIEKGSSSDFYSYTIMVPSSYEVLINGNDATGGIKMEIDGFSDGYKFVTIPYINKYEIMNLTKKPKIDIKSDDKEVVFKYDSTIDLSTGFKRYDSLTEANISFDAMRFAEKWSLYLTNDLTGTSHGLGTITPYLIKDTNMYKKAYQWGTSIDITFTSKHTLKNPIFTNEKISNVIVYSEDAASCDVKLEKNMIVNGKDKVDTFNSTIYLVKYNGEWKVINIKGVTNN